MRETEFFTIKNIQKALVNADFEAITETLNQLNLFGSLKDYNKEIRSTYITVY